MKNTDFPAIRISALVLGLAGCVVSAGPSVGSEEAVIFKPAGRALNATGVIDHTTADRLRRALDNNPGVDTLRLVWIPGSEDDESSLTELASLVRTAGLSITVPEGGMVASGGTDFLLMAGNRHVTPDACIGVHSWGSEDGSGANLSRHHPAHRMYLDFYRRVGIDEAFYWFTLDVAGPEDMHWMSPAEINRFGLGSVPVPDTGEPDFARNLRCENR